MLDLLGPHDWRLKQFFRDPRLRAMFTFQVMALCYVGLAECVLQQALVGCAVLRMELLSSPQLPCVM